MTPSAGQPAYPLSALGRARSLLLRYFPVLRTVRGWVRRLERRTKGAPGLPGLWLSRLTEPYILQNPYVAGQLFPLGRRHGYYLVQSRERVPGEEDFSVPPKPLWMGYGHTPEQHLASGRQDVAQMLDVFSRSGVDTRVLPRVLDLGCASGRMMRFYPFREATEVWGVDVSAAHIAWCQQHLSPPFFFATTTTMPHLPFEDGYFDLIYCGSVFTHISDLADAWFLELRRTLRPGGYAYITIHDKNTLHLLFTEYAHMPEYDYLRKMIGDVDRRDGVLSGAYDMFAIGRGVDVQVFYDAGRLISKWGRLMKVVSVSEQSYMYQTAVLLQK